MDKVIDESKLSLWIIYANQCLPRSITSLLSLPLNLFLLDLLVVTSAPPTPTPSPTSPITPISTASPAPSTPPISTLGEFLSILGREVITVVDALLILQLNSLLLLVFLLS